MPREAHHERSIWSVPILALPQVVVAHQLFHAFVAEAELQLLVKAVAFYYFAEKRL